MQRGPLDFLTRLLETPGPVGHEGAVQKVFEAYLDPYVDEFLTLPHGSVAGVRNPKGSPRIVVTGHADEVGLAVHRVDKEGFVFVRRLGGADVQTLPGSVMDVHTKGGVIPGVIGQKPIHLQDPEDRSKVTKIQDLYLDIGASTKAEAERRVRIGDPITYKRNIVHLSKDRVASNAMDNRTGVFCAAEAVRRLGKAKPDACVIALSTVGEEIGGDGAFTAAFELEPDVAIAIDVTFGSDQPDVSTKDTCEIHLGKGPAISRGPRLNENVIALLADVAKREKIPLQYELIEGSTGTDGDLFYRSRSGVPIGVVGVPCRYMHTPTEVVSLADLDAISRLLAAFVKRTTRRTRFDPF